MDVALVSLVLFAVTVPVLRHVREEDDSKATGRLVLALVLKLVGGLALYYVTFKFYKGGDANLYHPQGVLLARQFRHGDFGTHIQGGLIGNGWIELVAGVIYAIIGTTSKMAGFLVFAWLGFWGLYFFYRAFQIAVSRETAVRYARFIFFLPSLVFWSSSIGKDAWMVLSLGIASYGVARVLTHRRGGFFITALGLLGTAMVRPHVTLLIMIGVVLSYALRRSGASSGHSSVAKVVGLVVLVAGGVLVLSRVEQFLHINKLGQNSINQVLSKEASNSNYGTGAYSAPSASLTGLPQDAVTVLFRPFPWEANSSQQIAASLEGLFLISVFIKSWPRLRRLLRSLRPTPYVAFALSYSLLFVFFFSSFANFGLLARERDQLYPFVFVLLALPKPARSTRFPAQKRTPARSVAVVGLRPKVSRTPSVARIRASRSKTRSKIPGRASWDSSGGTFRQSGSAGSDR